MRRQGEVTPNIPTPSRTVPNTAEVAPIRAQVAPKKAGRPVIHSRERLRSIAAADPHLRFLRQIQSRALEKFALECLIAADEKPLPGIDRVYALVPGVYRGGVLEQLGRMRLECALEPEAVLELAQGLSQLFKPILASAQGARSKSYERCGEHVPDGDQRKRHGQANGQAVELVT